MAGVKEISARAKEIRKDGEKWTSAIKRASAELNGEPKTKAKKPESKKSESKKPEKRRRFQETL